MLPGWFLPSILVVLLTILFAVYCKRHRKYNHKQHSKPTKPEDNHNYIVTDKKQDTKEELKDRTTGQYSPSYTSSETPLKHRCRLPTHFDWSLQLPDNPQRALEEEGTARNAVCFKANKDTSLHLSSDSRTSSLICVPPRCSSVVVKIVKSGSSEIITQLLDEADDREDIVATDSNISKCQSQQGVGNSINSVNSVNRVRKKSECLVYLSPPSKPSCLVEEKQHNKINKMAAKERMTDMNANNLKDDDFDALVERAKLTVAQEKRLDELSHDDEDFKILNDANPSSSKISSPPAKGSIEDLRKQLNNERRLRRRAEEWSNMLERELDAHIDARKDSDKRYFKLQRKEKVYRHNYNKLMAKFTELSGDIELSGGFSMSRQNSVVVRQDSEEMRAIQDNIDVSLREKFERIYKENKMDEKVQQVEQVDLEPEPETAKTETEIETQRPETTEQKETSSETASKPVESAPQEARTESVVDSIVTTPSPAVKAHKDKYVNSRSLRKKSKTILEEEVAEMKLSDGAEESAEEPQPTEMEKFLETKAGRRSSGNNFDDVGVAKSYWEKQYKQMSKPQIQQKPVISLPTGVKSETKKKMFEQQIAAKNKDNQARKTDAQSQRETHKLGEKAQAFVKKLTEHSTQDGSHRGIELSKEELDEIQRKKQRVVEKLHGSANSSRLHDSDSDSDEEFHDTKTSLNDSCGSIAMKKQMFEEFSTSGSCSLIMSRRDSDSDNDLGNLSTQLDLSSRSHLDLSGDALSNIQQKKAMWKQADSEQNLSHVKGADSDNSDNEQHNLNRSKNSSGGEEPSGSVMRKLQHFQPSLANQRRCQSEEQVMKSEEPGHLVRVGSIKLKKQLWEQNSRTSPFKEEVADKDQDKSSSLIRVGSLKQKKDMLENKQTAENHDQNKPEAAHSLLEDKEAKKNITQNKARWREMENGKSRGADVFVSSNRAEDRLLKDEEEEILQLCQADSTHVKVESIKNVAGTKSKFEQIVSKNPQTPRGSSPPKPKTRSLARLTKEDFESKFSKFETKTSSNKPKVKGQGQRSRSSSSRSDTDKTPTQSGSEDTDSSSLDSESESTEKLSDATNTTNKSGTLESTETKSGTKESTETISSTEESNETASKPEHTGILRQKTNREPTSPLRQSIDDVNLDDIQVGEDDPSIRLTMLAAQSSINDSNIDEEFLSAQGQLRQENTPNSSELKSAETPSKEREEEEEEEREVVTPVQEISFDEEGNEEKTPTKMADEKSQMADEINKMADEVSAAILESVPNELLENLMHKPDKNVQKETQEKTETKTKEDTRISTAISKETKITETEEESPQQINKDHRIREVSMGDFQNIQDDPAMRLTMMMDEDLINDSNIDDEFSFAQKHLDRRDSHGEPLNSTEIEFEPSTEPSTEDSTKELTVANVTITQKELEEQSDNEQKDNVKPVDGIPDISAVAQSTESTETRDSKLKRANENAKPVSNVSHHSHRSSDSGSDYESFDEADLLDDMMENSGSKKTNKWTEKTKAETDTVVETEKSSRRHGIIMEDEDEDDNEGSQASTEIATDDDLDELDDHSSESVEAVAGAVVGAAVEAAAASFQQSLSHLSDTSSLDTYIDALDESSLLAVKRGSISLALAEDDFDDLGSDSEESSLGSDNEEEHREEHGVEHGV